VANLMPVVHAASYKKRRLIRVSKDTDPASAGFLILFGRGRPSCSWYRPKAEIQQRPPGLY